VNLLLDTHCLLWALTDAPQLDRAARRAIAAADCVWFSEASVWELGLKWRKGKIGMQPRRIVEQALRDRFRPLPITLEAILVSSELRQRHGDPFDRLLYAQARESGCRLLTIDRTLASFGARVLAPK
jgi:PIN domain nuclease of toxin-antitoxin system